MKKIILSLFVVFTFVFYAIYQRPLSAPVAIVEKKPVSTGTVPTAVNSAKAVVPVTQENTPTPTPVVVDSPTPVVAPTPSPSPVDSAPTPTPTPEPTPISTPVVTTDSGKYKNGEYIGNSVDAYYGNVQVKAIIQGGKISDVVFLDYPQHSGRSQNINSYAMPLLIQEAIQAQSAQVDGVSGASATSPAFIQSLGSALALAQN